MCRNTTKCKRARNAVLVSCGLALLLGLAIGYSAPAVREWSAGPCVVSSAAGAPGACSLLVAGPGGVPLGAASGEVYPRLNASAPCGSFVGAALACWTSRYDTPTSSSPPAGPCFGGDAKPAHSSTGAFRIAFGLAFGICFGLLLMSCFLYGLLARASHAGEAACRGRLECCARRQEPARCPCSARDVAAVVSAVCGLALALALGFGYAAPAAADFVSVPCNVTAPNGVSGTRQGCLLSLVFARYWLARVDLASVVPAQSAVQCETPSGRAAIQALSLRCWYIPSQMESVVRRGGGGRGRGAGVPLE